MFKPVSPKVDFPAMERELLKEWYNKGIVEKYLKRNEKSEKRFSFLDGPITANNPMGVHHGWGRTYKDLWQRFWNMRGYKQRFQNGFDCQGLWVEVEVEKELGIRNKKDIENLVSGDKKASIARFVELCKERVYKFSAIQTDQSKRLGYFMDWDNSYFTMSDENNYMIWHFLKTCFDKGWIYKGHDSVPWCPRCQTAISQHEMLTEDYKELTHETVFVKLPITTKGWENTSLVIWTTTPWTVPANVAVGVNVKFTYRLFEDSKTKERLIILNKDENGEAPLRTLHGDQVDVAQYIFDGLDGIDFQGVKDILGKELIGLQYDAPFDYLPRVKEARKENPEKFHTVVDGSEIVTAGEGTGLLHVAPGAGKEDFDLGKKEKLPVISVIADDASYLDRMEEFSGKNAKKHPELIIEYLKTKGEGRFLLKTLKYTHRYPACWRCKSELVWKVTDEWYIAMDKPENGNGETLRNQMIKTAKMIDWHPDFGLERELDWLKNMHDWLISKKNRYWGLALPIYECQKCGKFEVIGSKEELQKRAVNGWKELEGHSPHKPFIDEVTIKCSHCGEAVSRIDDVGNVWLDAGIVPFSTFIDSKTKELSYITDKKYWKEWFPVDFITESFPGQFKNWFYSMIAMSTVLEKKNPFKTILGYASMLAEDGRPMHKSWGNSIEFNEGADKIGVDVMRWMYVTADPEQNLLFGYKRADETRRHFHLMLWNVYNFFITYANIDQWKPDSGQARMTSENVLDTWILSRLQNTIRMVESSLEKYDAQKATQNIESFVNDLSLWYIRRSRERVGPSAESESDKNLFYITCHEVLVTLSKLLAPFTPFLAEEIYQNLTNEVSVHLTNWPKVDEKLINKKLEKEMEGAKTVASYILSMRKSTNVKIKIPLRVLYYSGPTEFNKEILEIVKKEVNANVLKLLEKKEDWAAGGDSDYTNQDNQDLIAGEVRDIIRKIQAERKNLGTTFDEKVDVMLPDWPKDFEDEIKRKALIKTLSKGDIFSVSRI